MVERSKNDYLQEVNKFSNKKKIRKKIVVIEVNMQIQKLLFPFKSKLASYLKCGKEKVLLLTH